MLVLKMCCDTKWAGSMPVKEDAVPLQSVISRLFISRSRESTGTKSKTLDISGGPLR
jgi:hypothetical protein